MLKVVRYEGNRRARIETSICIERHLAIFLFAYQPLFARINEEHPEVRGQAWCGHRREACPGCGEGGWPQLEKGTLSGSCFLPGGCSGGRRTQEWEASLLQSLPQAGMLPCPAKALLGILFPSDFLGHLSPSNSNQRLELDS